MPRHKKIDCRYLRIVLNGICEAIERLKIDIQGERMKELVSSKDNSRDVFLTKDEVSRQVDYSVPSIYRLIAAGTFPRPKKLGARKVRWLQSDITDWIKSLEYTKKS